MKHLETTGETIRMEDVPEDMFDGALLVAKSRKTKKIALTEAEYLDDASEQPSMKAKKAKKEKASIQVNEVGPAVPTIQEEVQDLAHAEVLNKRTRSGKTVGTSQPQPAQPSIPKKKRKHVVRKLKIAPKEKEVEEENEIVSREVRRKKEVDAAALEKALRLAKEIEVPAEVLIKESTVEVVQLGIELTENLQQMVVADELVKAADEVHEEAGYSKVDASEVHKGNNGYSSTSSDSRSTPASLSTSSSTSSDMDDIPLNRVYENLNKRLSLSPSTKTEKKPDSDTFVHMYPSIEERIHDMQQRRINACVRLHVDHPLQPPMIEHIQFVPADAEGVNDHIRSESANIDVSLSPTKTTTETHEPSVIQGLINHYSRELPGYETNLERASDLASDEVMTESPNNKHLTQKWPH